MLLTSLLQIVAAGAAFTCTPVAIWDGDGPIWCAEGPKVRIAGVAAREMDGTCRPNQPCPATGATGRATASCASSVGLGARLRLATSKSGPNP